ncbi:Hypothetical predicted protein [Octopus vulgaris]|uniref:Uncharacterized protein n=1 Tax=Octopus vulgaris TaxID=6645 RepID=A0AA36F3Y2_OCTVU|nr:Hypothetical predicted protein [Octopus vulgaris]
MNEKQSGVVMNFLRSSSDVLTHCNTSTAAKSYLVHCVQKIKHLTSDSKLMISNTVAALVLYSLLSSKAYYSISSL